MDMIYFSMFHSEFYLFDTDATWEKAAIEHPALDLKKRFDEKLWLDKLRIINS